MQTGSFVRFLLALLDLFIDLLPFGPVRIRLLLIGFGAGLQAKFDEDGKMIRPPGGPLSMRTSLK